MKVNLLSICFVLFSALLVQATVFAEEDRSEEAKEKMEEVGNDTARGGKKAWRGAKDKTCEMVNGKMECAGQKAKHSIQNGVDNVEDAID